MGYNLVVTVIPEECFPDLYSDPGASWMFNIVANDVWIPPEEPPMLSRKGRREYFALGRALRQSLEDFLNRKLSQLYNMRRTGHYIIGAVEAKISRFQPVPEPGAKRGCPQIHFLSRYVAGNVRDDYRKTIKAHLKKCDRCRRVVRKVKDRKGSRSKKRKKR